GRGLRAPGRAPLVVPRGEKPVPSASESPIDGGGARSSSSSSAAASSSPSTWIDSVCSRTGPRGGSIWSRDDDMWWSPAGGPWRRFYDPLHVSGNAGDFAHVARGAGSA